MDPPCLFNTKRSGLHQIGAGSLRSRGEAARGAVPYQLLVDAVRPRLAREHAPEDLVADVWLTELVRLFPELRERYPDLPPPAALAGDAAGGPARLFEAVHQLILALAERARPGALVMCYDDVQWSDLAVRDLLLYRLRRQAEASAPAAAGADGADGGAGPRTGAGAVAEPAGAPGADHTPELWGRWPRRRPRRRSTPCSPSRPRPCGEDGLPLESWLYAQSEGQPFYLVELLRTLVDHGFLVPCEPEPRWHGPGGRAAPGARPRRTSNCPTWSPPACTRSSATSSAA